MLKIILQEHNLDNEVLEQAEIQVKYAGYIAKEKIMLINYIV